MDPTSDMSFKRTVLAFLRGQPGGVPLREFEALYRQQYGRQLELSRHGYWSLRQLLAEMKDQVAVDETGEQPWVRIRHGFVYVPHVKRNLHVHPHPSVTDYGQLKYPKPSQRPWTSCHGGPSSAYPLMRRTKVPLEAGSDWATSRSLIPSRLRVAAPREEQRLTLSSRVSLPGSRLPLPDRLRERSRTGGKAISLMTLEREDGQVSGGVKKVLKCWDQSLPALPKESAASPITEGQTYGFCARDPSPHRSPAADGNFPISFSTMEATHGNENTLKALEDRSNVCTPNSPAGLPCAALLGSPPLLEQQSLEKRSVAILSPEDDGVEAIWPAGLSHLEQIPNMTAAPEGLNLDRCCADATFCFPNSNAQKQLLPSQLTKSGKVPSVSLPLPPDQTWPVASCCLAQNLSSTQGLVQGPPGENLSLDRSGPIFPVHSPKALLETTVGSPLTLDFISRDLEDLPETKTIPKWSSLNSHSPAKAAEPSVSFDLQEVVSSARLQLHNDSEGSDSPAQNSSTEEVVLQSLEEVANGSLSNSLANGIEEQSTPAVKPKHNYCVVL